MVTGLRDAPAGLLSSLPPAQCPCPFPAFSESRLSLSVARCRVHTRQEVGAWTEVQRERSLASNPRCALLSLSEHVRFQGHQADASHVHFPECPRTEVGDPECSYHLPHRAGRPEACIENACVITGRRDNAVSGIQYAFLIDHRRE